MAKGPLKISTPLTEETLKNLKVGDNVLITGTLYTGRDAAHKRLFDLIQQGKDLPFNVQGQIIYYVGPTPTKPGKVIGSAGPTTSSRMDAYTPALIAKGLKGMIGKGARVPEVVEAMKTYHAVYFAAIGGAAALLAKCIRKNELVAYEELGPEAIRRLEVENFPVIVANDIYGNDLFVEGVKQYSR